MYTWCFVVSTLGHLSCCRMGPLSQGGPKFVLQERDTPPCSAYCKVYLCSYVWLGVRDLGLKGKGRRRHSGGARGGHWWRLRSTLNIVQKGPKFHLNLLVGTASSLGQWGTSAVGHT